MRCHRAQLPIRRDSLYAARCKSILLCAAAVPHLERVGAGGQEGSQGPAVALIPGHGGSLQEQRDVAATCLSEV
jgi:hypothetical protein